MPTQIPRLSPHDRPGACGFYPHIVADPEGFIVGATLEGPHPGDVRQVISITGLRELAARHGMYSREDYEALHSQLQEERAERERVEEELKYANRELDGVDALTKRGLVVRKAPGRKPNKKPSNEETQ